MAIVPISTHINPARIAREVIEASPESEGWDFARECVDRIPQKDREQYLLSLFYSHYSQFVGKLRNNAIESAKNWSPSNEPALPEAQTFFDGDGGPLPLMGPARWKQENFWAQRVYLGRDGYKSLGDLTVSDLEFVINYREGVAAANKRRADEYRAIHDYMVENQLSVASEVGDKVRSLLKNLQ